MATYKFISPKFALWGKGAINMIPEEIKPFNVKKALVVTDKGMRATGILQKVLDVFDGANMEYCVYEDVKPNPTTQNIYDGVDVLKENNCDYIVSIGGGSAHDCAKGISMIATNGGDIKSYIGYNKSKMPPLPVVSINTTAGTASECTLAYVISVEETKDKYGIRDDKILPVIAVDDHELMMGLPRGLTASTGMDALTHAIESYVSNRSYLISREIALSAIKVIVEWLEIATNNPTEEAREGMAVGQYLAGLSFSNNGCGLVHSISHQLSAVYDLPHGLSNAILLPVCMKYLIRDEEIKNRYSKIAHSTYPIETNGMDVLESAEYLIKKVEDISNAVGTVVKLSTLGVKEEDFGMLADKAMLDGTFVNNILKPTRDEIIEIIKQVM